MGKVVKLRRPAAAANGAYGSVPYNRVAGLAASLLDAIKEHLDGADFFTREDLLQLDVFDNVSTISRYRLLCLAVRYLVSKRELVEQGWTDLCLPARARSYPGGGAGSLADSFGPALRARLPAQFPRGEFSVGEAVKRWVEDPHLTRNVKRVVMRRVLAAMVREGALRLVAENTYIFAEGE